MKSITTIKGYGLCLLLFLVFGCRDNFPESNVDIQDRILWFDASYGLMKEPGKDYPLLAEVTSGSGMQIYTINLTGPSYDIGKSFHYQVVEGETTAQEGVHYRLVDDGKYLIPGREKKGSIRVEIPTFQSDSDGTVILVLELIGRDGVGVDQSYGQIGIPILLRIPPEPIPDVALYEALTQGTLIGGRTYNNIFLDPLNGALPLAFRQGFEEARSRLQAEGNKRTPVHALIHFSSSNEVVFVAAWLHTSTEIGTVSRAVMRLRYTFEPDANGVGKFVFKEAWSNGHYRTGGQFAPILQEYLEKYEFKVDWVNYDIVGPPRPGAWLGGLYRIDETTGEPTGDILFGTLENVDPAQTTINPNQQLGLQYSPTLYEALVIDPGLRNVTYDDYYNAIVIDPDATYQSAGFKSLWDLANTEVASREIVLQKWVLWFRPYTTFFDVTLATYYTKNGGNSRGRMQFDFRVDNEGNLRPLYFFAYGPGDGITGPESRTDALIDDLLMTKEFKISRNGDRVRFTDRNDAAFYFEGELDKYTQQEFNNLTWIP